MLEITKNVTMNNIPFPSLPHFNGMTSEDFDSFLFEFDTLCRSNNYTDNSKKLKLFLSTLKISTLRWYMSLGKHTITSWDDMNSTFL